MNVVYPEMTAIVDLEPGNISCFATEETFCVATIPNYDVYSITLTLSNVLGQSEPAVAPFKCEYKICI